MRNQKAGEETIKKLANIYEKQRTIPFIELFGSYYVVIQEPNGKLTMFTDHSHLHCFFIGDHFLGTNFLEVIKENKARQFDHDALCEYLEFGKVLFGKTLYKNIKLSEPRHYYLLENGNLIVKDKTIGGIDKPSSIKDVNEFFKEMAYSLSDLSVTMSLTGGYDSRMIFANLNQHIPIKPFISGNNPKSKDIVISQKVAKAGGSFSEVIETPKVNVTEQYILSLFQNAQGISLFLNNSYIRIHTFVKNRKNKGFHCYITGAGGEMHKEIWWLADFPFYRKKSVNLNRFYEQRIHFQKEHVAFGEALEKNRQILKQRIVQELEKYKMPFNTQTYDSLFFQLKGKENSINFSVMSKFLPSYAPLWELELVRYSYQLPRSSQFFNYSMRKITTKASKNIARVPTDYGTTSSSEVLYIMRDILFQGVDYFIRACRMVARKYFNKNLFIGESQITWSIEQEVRSLPLAKKSLDYCINNNFIKEGTKMEDLSFSLLGRVIQVYLLGKYTGIQ
ncbi:hypothetical protein [Ureibacillus xyleni]|nr:hypothetical protein [Ureibacillus xyleni]